MSEKFTRWEWLIDSIGIEGPLYPVLRFSILCIPAKGEKLNLSDDAMRSNAALIAAAPEMYECVCDALTDLEMSEGMRAHFEKVLKKARGEEC